MDAEQGHTSAGRPVEPADGGDALVDRIVERCLAQSDAGLDTAVAAACREQPRLATAILNRIRLLRECGLLHETVEDAVPERLGSFRILSRLGGGGMGIVFLAEQDEPRRRVALKVVRPESLFFADSRERFQREVDAAASLAHPGIVPVYSVGEERGIPFYAMEVVDGCSLAEALAPLRGRAPERLRGEHLRAEVRPAASTPAPLFSGSWIDTCLRVALAVADSLDHAHARGILHRDVKPSNVMLTAAGRVVLLDFGLAWMASAAELTHTGSRMGSLPYMAPEQVRGDPAGVDARTDVYALGVTLYELLTLARPHAGRGPEDTMRKILTGQPRPVRQRNRSVTWDVEVVCRTAMEPDPARRYQTAGDFALDLRNLLERRPIAARAPGALLRARRWAQRHPAFAVAGALLLLMAAAGPAAITLGIARERDAAVVAREVAERHGYAAGLAAAQLALRTDDGPQARLHLDASPPHLREWEWRHLSLQADESLLRLPGSGRDRQAPALAADGSRLAAVRADGGVAVWAIPDGALVAELPAGETPFDCVAFDPLGRGLLVTRGTEVLLWQAPAPPQAFAMVGARSRHLSVSPQSSLIVLGRGRSTVLIDLASGATLRQCAMGTVAGGLRLSGREAWHLELGVHDVVVHELSTGRALRSIPASGVMAATWSADGTRSIHGTRRGWIEVRDAQSGAKRARIRSGSVQVTCLAAHPDGRRLAVGSLDGTLRVLDLEREEVLFTLHGHGEPLQGVAFTPDGEWLVSNAADRTIRLWDPTAPLARRALDWGRQLGRRVAEDVVKGLATASDGRVAFTARDGAVRIVDARSGDVLATLWGHERQSTCVAFDESGRHLASGGADHSIRLWDTTRSEELLCLDAPGHGPEQIALHPSATKIASAGKDGVVRLWDCAAQACSPLTPAPGTVLALRFAPEGDRLACRGGDGVLHIWDAGTGRCLGSFATRAEAIAARALSERAAAAPELSEAFAEVHRQTAADADGSTPMHMRTRVSLAASPDGRRIVAGTMGGALRVWDGATARPLLPFPTLAPGIGALRFTADGTGLVLGRGDGEVVVLESERTAERPSERLARRRTREEAGAVLAAGLREHALHAEVIRGLEQRDDLPDPVRAAAIAMARARGGDGARLVQEAWSIASLGVWSPERYAEAHRAAQAAVERDPANLRALCVLGLAQTRVGDTRTALATLRRACTAGDDAPGFEPLCLVQLAVLLHAAGRHDEGRPLLDRLDRLQAQPRHRSDLLLDQALHVTRAAYASR